MERNTSIIYIPTSDSIVWGIESILVDICSAMSKRVPIYIDLVEEGPDLQSSGIYDNLTHCANMFEYPLSNITIKTNNSLERHPEIKIHYYPPMAFIKRVKKNTHGINTVKNIQKHFGIFVGRSNAPRLLLSTVLNNYESAVQSFHYSPLANDSRGNNGLEEIINSFNKSDVTSEARFLSISPILLSKEEEQYPYWDNQEYSKIYTHYSNFFIEVVCETCYSGNTFFPTEKTWRPIATKTPFIIQGPQHYLKSLRSLGFKTFGDFWDEGYDDDPYSHSIFEVINIIEDINRKTIKELKIMYNKMKPILEHNYAVFQNLTRDDFIKLDE